MHFLYLGIAAVVSAAPMPLLAPNYLENAAAGMVAMQSWYEEYSGLWQNVEWWQNACLLSTVAELAAIDPSFMANATAIFDNTYELVPGRFEDGEPNWGKFDNPWYDDAGWWALAWIAGYDITQNEEYLRMGEAIFNNQLTGNAAPSRCGNGGIMWMKNDPYVNAIANELYLSVAAHLASRVKDAEKRATYLQTAKDQWAWFQASGMINPNNNINDGVDLDCQNHYNSTLWTYNQGVILGALVELNLVEPARDNSYLDTANAIALAALEALTDPSTGILHESCESSNNCDNNQHQFKGIFMRNLLQLHRATPKDLYADFIRVNADRVQDSRDAETGAFPVNWADLYNPTRTASTTSAGLDAIIAAAAVNLPSGYKVVDARCVGASADAISEEL